ncbi:MAG: leucyl aminopeptidase [Thermodesulfovibrionales bacterium]
MELTLKPKASLKRLDTEVLVLPVVDDSVEKVLEVEDLKEYSHLIRYVLLSGEFKKGDGDACLIHNTASGIKRILLVDLGITKERHPEEWLLKEDLRRAGGKAARYLRGKDLKEISICCDFLPSLSPDTKPVFFYFVEGFLLSLYRFDSFKTKKEETSIKKINIVDPNARDYINRLNSIYSSSNMIRDLINSPSNRITPRYLLDVAKSIKSPKVNVRALNFKLIQKEGMNGILSVAQGSIEPPYLIVIEYNTKKDTSPILIIGKTVTFDSGGISIKPSEGLERMKYDMAGGAVVLGIMRCLVDLDARCSVVGILPAVENMPGGKAYKPGDIIKMMNGKTVEIITTDAEGRLTLADAITYGKKYYKPSTIIDIATLTGACAITFGNDVIGMMGTDEEMMKSLYSAGQEAYEMVWEMPLYREYGEYIKGDFGDIKNSGGRNGAMLTAGYFLKEFAEETPWVHLDIASTAWLEKDKPYLNKGASGSGLRLLLEMLMKHV